ncbi:hypothetical protein bAD24_I14450 [Burkholderia sp. AD24]|nr:hypothetical protein bAD24_I14450 [Burkholderia sp. AD24]
MKKRRRSQSARVGKEKGQNVSFRLRKFNELNVCAGWREIAFLVREIQLDNSSDGWGIPIRFARAPLSLPDVCCAPRHNLFDTECVESASRCLNAFDSHDLRVPFADGLPASRPIRVRRCPCVADSQREAQFAVTGLIACGAQLYDVAVGIKNRRAAVHDRAAVFDSRDPLRIGRILRRLKVIFVLKCPRLASRESRRIGLHGRDLRRDRRGQAGGGYSERGGGRED